MDRKFLRSGGRILSHNPTGPQPRPGSQIIIDEDIFVSRDRGYIAGDFIPGGLYTAEELLEIMKREFDNPSDTVQIIVTVSPANGGFVTSSYTYDKGAEVMLQAAADNWFEFDHWSIGGDSETVTCIADTDKTITAYFKQIPHVKLSLIGSPSNSYARLEGAGEYDFGEPITIYAEPKHHFHFKNWSDGSPDSEHVIIITSEEEVTYVAYFAEDAKFTIQGKASGTEGEVTGSGIYYAGETYTLEAIPNTDYIFVKWSDGITDRVRTGVAARNLMVNAIFKEAPYDPVNIGVKSIIVNNPVIQEFDPDYRPYEFYWIPRLGGHCLLEFTINPKADKDKLALQFFLTKTTESGRHANWNATLKGAGKDTFVIDNYLDQCQILGDGVMLDKESYSIVGPVDMITDDHVYIDFTVTWEE